MVKLTLAMALQLLAIVPVTIGGAIFLIAGVTGLWSTKSSQDIVWFGFSVLIGISVACLVTAIVSRPHIIRAHRLVYGFIAFGLVPGCGFAGLLVFAGVKVGGMHGFLEMLPMYGIPLVLGTFHCFRISSLVGGANNALHRMCEDARR